METMKISYILIYVGISTKKKYRFKPELKIHETNLHSTMAIIKGLMNFATKLYNQLHSVLFLHRRGTFVKK